jgi:hypothetical protein
MLKRHPTLIAALYWIFAALVYIGGLYQPNNEGGIPTVIVTLPWSIVMLGILASLDSIGLLRTFLGWLATDIGNFLMFPFFCGGLNAAIIYAFGRYQRAKSRHASRAAPYTTT